MTAATDAPLLLEVEDAAGPGVDFERVGHELVGRRVRRGGLWLGFDRGAVLETDDGAGTRLAAVVALPASTHAGCRLEAEPAGGWLADGRLVVVARLAGAPSPLPALARLAAGVPEDAAWLDAAAVGREVQHARQRFRERRAHARILGGRAWHGAGHGAGASVEASRFTTPHSAAEYRLDGLPQRFLRGLAGLLDDDERLLYAIERPEDRDAGIVARTFRREDRRAALLALTDRQLLWVVDHADPDRFLGDWGVDVEVVPVERITAVDVLPGPGSGIAVATDGGRRAYRLPAELGAEIAVLARLIRRFVAAADESPLRRLYGVPAVEPEEGPLDAFGQAAEARAAVAAERRAVPVLGAFYDPRRPGVRGPSLVVLREDAVALRSATAVRSVRLDDVAALGITLSALVGRLVVRGRTESLDLRFPAPLSTGAAAWVRSARRALANR